MKFGYFVLLITHTGLKKYFPQAWKESEISYAPKAPKVKLCLDNIISRWYFIVTHDMSRNDMSCINMSHKDVLRKAMQYKVAPYKAIQHETALRKAIQYKAAPCKAIQHKAAWQNTPAAHTV